MIDTILSKCYDIIILIISIMERIISMGKQANNIKRFIITLTSLLFIITGCSDKSVNTHNYDLTKISYWDSMYITQTTYYDDRVEIEVDGQFTEKDFEFGSPDVSNSKKDKKNNTLIIYSDNPENITSLIISNSWYEVDFRYLNTDEYACIWQTWADDLGWEYFGDGDKYYNEEEKKQQREAEEQRRIQQEQAQKEDAELFAVFKGKWTSDDGDYFDIYDAGSGHGVKYYQNESQRTEEYYDFKFSKHNQEDRYSMTYSENGFGVNINYEIEYSGEDTFIYDGKTFKR